MQYVRSQEVRTELGGNEHSWLLLCPWGTARSTICDHVNATTPPGSVEGLSGVAVTHHAMWLRHATVRLAPSATRCRLPSHHRQPTFHAPSRSSDPAPAGPDGTLSLDSNSKGATFSSYCLHSDGFYSRTCRAGAGIARRRIAAAGTECPRRLPGPCSAVWCGPMPRRSEWPASHEASAACRYSLTTDRTRQASAARMIWSAVASRRRNPSCRASSATSRPILLR